MLDHFSVSYKDYIELGGGVISLDLHAKGNIRIIRIDKKR